MMKTGGKPAWRFQWRRWNSKVLAWTLSFAFLIPSVDAAAVNAAYRPQDHLCIHHPEHTEDCGYTPSTEEGTCTHEHDENCGYKAPVEGSACTHEHDEDCGYAAPAEGSACTHEHDENCGYAASAEGSACTHEHDGNCGYIDGDDSSVCTHEHDGNCGYTAGNGSSPCTHEHDDTCGYIAPEEGSACTHEHDENCGYKDAVEGSPCTHEHDENCGYTEGTGGSSCSYVCELCVLDWSWNDEAGVLVWNDEENLWGLGLPGVDEGNPLTREALAELLPESVEAKTAAASQTVDLSWDLEEFPDSAFEGEFMLDALLSGEYVLTEDAPALQLVVALGGGETYVDSAKYLNQWSFIARNGDKVAKDNAITVEIDNLRGRKPEEIIQWLQNTALPNEIRGWTLTSTDPNNVLSRVGFKIDGDQEETKYATSADGTTEITSTAYQWGRVGIQWKVDLFPTQFDNGDTFTLQAEIETVTDKGNTYNIYVNSNDPADYIDGTQKDTQNNPAILSLKVTLKENNGKEKYLNQWSFINRDDTMLPEDSTVTAAIANLRSRSSEEVIHWLKDTVLPMEIRGWTTNGDPNGVLSRVGFEPYDNLQDAMFETTAEDPKKPVPSNGRTWGHVKILWEDSSFPAEFAEGQTFTLQAEIPTAQEGIYAYNIYVNSNKSEDYKDSNGKPSDDAKDTKTKPEILSLNVTIRNIDLAGHTVPAANPENVTVNLFDYWARTEIPSADTDGDLLVKSDNHFHEVGATDQLSEHPALYSAAGNWNLGINRNHLLLFGDGMIHAGLWNKGAGENCRYGNLYAGMEKIVKATLNKEGYPELNLALATEILKGDNSQDYTKIKDYKLAGDHNDKYGTDYNSDSIQNLSNTVMGTWGRDVTKDTESLQYLFDPADNHPFKKSYTDVKGLFQLDDQGYYYYNMRENFAEFCQDNGNNYFVLYDAPATLRTDGEQSVGNFFPFNKGYEVFNGMDAGGELTSSVYCARNAMNHHLGMTVDVDFRQPANGMLHTGTGSQPMTFQFAGDDDVWVFIDDVLVLDLGGVHSELYGTIDFATGDVYVGRAFGIPGIPDNPSDPAHMVTHTTLRDAYKAAGKEGNSSWNNKTFASNTSHTLKMFYLERGNYDSSIALRFNLQPLLYQRIVKVNQEGQPLPGVEFQLYPAQRVGGNNGSAIQCMYTDSGVPGSVFYVQPDYSDSLVTLQTDENGSAVFLTPDGSYFNFADRGDQYYVLKETDTRNGYRTQPVDIVLHYDTGTSMLSVANRWTTGAYACSVSHVTGAGWLNYGGLANGMIGPVAETVSAEDQGGGLVVAVPLLQKKSNGSWLALYGSNMGGFYSVPIARNEEMTWRRATLTAALEQAGAGNTADWHLDWDSGNSRLYGTLNDLPGLASRYQLNNPDGSGDMHMVYGIISADALQGMGDTPEERYDALREYLKAHSVEEACDTFLGSFRFLCIDQFNRDFRSLVYIPNEQRELRVMKVDQEDNPLQGTRFGLFSDEDCKVEVASGVTDAKGMLIFSPGGGNGAGQAQMVWANSTNTRYYLKETMAPAGYDLNETVIPIIVGIYAIYADAGTEEDGVSVMAGVGRLTQTMRQFAMDSDVDITLQDITAYMQTQPSGSFQLTGWQDEKEEGTNAVISMNLHFGKNAEVDYGLHDEDGGKTKKPFFVTDSGFIRTRVRQNYAALTSGQYEGTNEDVNKDNLGETDLTSLFSLLNIVVVTDRKETDTGTGRLTISKKVTGNGLTEEDYSRDFVFAVELKDSGGNPLYGTFEYCYNNGNKSGHVASGGELLLHHGESVTITGLPVGTKFTVTEKQESDWYVIPESGFYTGEIASDGNFVAEFSNSKDKDKDEKEGKDPGKKDPPTASGNSSSDPVSPSGASGTPTVSSDEPDAVTPATGDESMPGRWILLIGVSLLGMVLVFYIKHHHDKR